MKNFKRFVSFSTLSLIFLMYQNFIMPEFPSRNIDTLTVQKVKGKYQTLTPMIPMNNFTLDGRLAFRQRGANSLFIIKPEKIINHLKDSRNSNVGANLIEEEPDYTYKPLAFYGDFRNTSIGSNFTHKNVLICEKTEKNQNPYLCETNKDCYDITLVSIFEYENLVDSTKQMKLASVDVTVVVANPKTTDAKIERVTMIPKTQKVNENAITQDFFAEPSIVGDNRLLIFRIGNGQVTLSNGEPSDPNINIVYSTYPESYPQCDVTQWSKQHPIAHAHHDTVNEMKRRYKFARYPLRDSLGNILPDGKEFGGSYPWMDKDAANLFFTAFGSDAFYNFSKSGPLSAFEESTAINYYTPMKESNLTNFLLTVENVEEGASRTQGITMAGFWSHGKMVLLDGLNNNADYAFRVSDRIDALGNRIDVERMIKLYKNSPPGQTYEKVGAVRELGDAVLVDEYNANLPTNSTFIGSIENRLNYNSKIFPVTPRDVVWHFGNTRHQEEVVFDDFLSPYFIVNAEMTAAISNIEGANKMRHYSGFKSSVAQPSEFVGYPAKPEGSPALIQNAATSPDDFIKVPSYGKIHGGARIEPIAKGGIHGKGLWLDENSGVSFQIPRQNSSKFNLSNNASWFLGVFIDARDSVEQNEYRELISISESKKILLRKIKDGPHLLDRIVFTDQDKIIGFFQLPEGLEINNNKWKHLGFSFKSHQAPKVYIDGFYAGDVKLHKLSKPSEINLFFKLKDDDILVLGKSFSGINKSLTGWFDDFKVIARNPELEEICNYARGTLIKFTADNKELLAAANKYPYSAQTQIRELVRESNTFSKFSCFKSYDGGVVSGDKMIEEGHAHLKKLPIGAKSIREKALKIKGSLVFNSPRPDFTKNKFCLSCHLDSTQNPNFELNDTSLLKISGLKMQDDRRRQPLQPNKYLRGVIPANYFGPGLPASTINAPQDSPVPVDQFMHPELKNINVSWSNLGIGYTYSITLKDYREKITKRYLRCVHSDILKSTKKYSFNGTCFNKKGSTAIPLTSEVSIKVCAAKDEQWDGSEVCSDFTPVTYQEDGFLNLIIKKPQP